MKNKSFIIFVCISLLIILLAAMVYEVRDVPDVEWKEGVRYDDDGPNGFYILKEMANKYYENAEVSTKKYYQDTSLSNSLYVYISEFDIGESQLDTIINVANHGNDFLLIVSDFPYQFNDSTAGYFSADYVFSDKLTLEVTNRVTNQENTYNYKFQDREFKQLDSAGYFVLMEDEYNPGKNRPVIKANESHAMMVHMPVGEGNIYFHILPELFRNYSYREDSMFNYTQDVYSFFDPEAVFFLETINGMKNSPSSHPLQYIMSSPPLKAAYLLLIFALLAYVIFGGKRRQKVIPISEKNENTSLEYIETVSQLFYQQGKHEKLVKHIRDIFYYKMEKKFFIKKDHPNYLETLAKKSKVPKEELSFVLNRYKNVEDRFTFQPDQLAILHKRVEQIYAFIESVDNQSKPNFSSNDKTTKKKNVVDPNAYNNKK